MSEYQYHEWQTVDRVLTPEEQSAVDELSSHIDVSSSRAVVTYNWGDFKHDPKEVLLQYFDAYFYFANWGTLQLMFRFPTGLIDAAEIEPYCDDEFVSFETYDEYQVLDLTFNSEGGGWYLSEEADLSDFIHLRAELLEGDYRLLYLAWLSAKTFFDSQGEEYEKYEYEEEEEEDVNGDSEENYLEPPIPPGLKKLSPSLENFVRVLDLDPFLVQAAAETSPDLKRPTAVDYRSLIAQLTRSECDDYLTRLADGDSGAGLALRKRLNAFQPAERNQPANPRPLEQLINRAEELRIAEEKRRAEAARKKHIAEMNALATQAEQKWQQVDDLLEHGQKIASVYDGATTILDKLDQLAEFKNTRGAFRTRVHTLAEKYASRPSLMKRWRQRGWII